MSLRQFSQTDGRTNVFGFSVRLHFTSKRNKKSTAYKYKYQRLAAVYGKWPHPVLHKCSMHLDTPVPKRAHSCQWTVQVTFCSTASITLLLWAVCSTLHTVSTQLHDTPQNCCGSPFAALLHTVAVRWQHITPAGQNLSDPCASPLQSDPTWFPTTSTFTAVGSAFHSNISIQHVQQCDIVEPTLRVTAHNLPYSSDTTCCVLKVTSCNSTDFNKSQNF